MAPTQARKTARKMPGTADPAEVARFEEIASAWWDADGAFKPLHRLNPARIRFIRDEAASRLDRDPLKPAPLAGLKVLDVGCGGGLLTEPMTRLGADVTGIDAGEENVRAARHHAQAIGLAIDYRTAAPEDLAAENRTFDLVLNMEVVEHAVDRDAFLEMCCRLVKPGGWMALSTLNRTLKSLALAKIGAEYVLRWLPIGTHDWRKFVRPSEMARGLALGGMEIQALKGIVYDPMDDEWRLADDLAVNYLAFAVKP